MVFTKVFKHEAPLVLTKGRGRQSRFGCGVFESPDLLGIPFRYFFYLLHHADSACCWRSPRREVNTRSMRGRAFAWGVCGGVVRPAPCPRQMRPFSGVGAWTEGKFRDEKRWFQGSQGQPLFLVRQAGGRRTRKATTEKTPRRPSPLFRFVRVDRWISHLYISPNPARSQHQDRVVALFSEHAHLNYRRDVSKATYGDARAPSGPYMEEQSRFSPS
jgi:hypothetical protein